MTAKEYYRATGGFWGITRFNCLAFALGQTKRRKSKEYVLPEKAPDGRRLTMEESFLLVCERLGVRVRRVEHEEMGHTYARLYGSRPDRSWHFTRREPDGRVYQKCGWGLPPDELRNTDPGDALIFEILDD